MIVKAITEKGVAIYDGVNMIASERRVDLMIHPHGVVVEEFLDLVLPDLCDREDNQPTILYLVRLDNSDIMITTDYPVYVINNAGNIIEKF